MSSTGGLCSFLLCRSTQKIFRSKNLHDSPHPSPHTNSPASTNDLLHEGFRGYCSKVIITYRLDYGCSRMGVPPPIIRWFSSRWLSPPPGLSLSGGDARVSVWFWFLSLIPLYVGFDWICFLGLFWQRLFGTHHFDSALLASSWLLVATAAAAVRKRLGGGSCVCVWS
ncbi:hypothetical protein RchiOBHm_Chr4g0428101 [Rosa chinensis]|uniref:Uncharacterized protein n=1 Tax=Rosa chinensis TaxID=74649 RepID=A0A2P6QZU3_ROSCH|nr:hypothetical protein RchiOBHm_Chr4g0428101 [Rosa chinensis]